MMHGIAISLSLRHEGKRLLNSSGLTAGTGENLKS